jgi:dTDP-4-amino-4,6-dideoxygalactose transaminase
LYDLDSVTLSPDLDSIRRTIARGVDAIVITHLYGYPADFAGVNEIAAANGIPVIEDAAQAAGGALDGVRLGALGNVSILSFGRGKGLTAGSGGALLLRGPDSSVLAREIAARIEPGRRGGAELVTLAAQWVLARPTLYYLPGSIPALKLGEMVYHQAAEPRGISNTAASILAAALAMESGETTGRRRLAKTLLSSIGDGQRVSTIRSIKGGEPGYLRLPLIDRAGDFVPDQGLGAIRGYPMTLDQHSQLASSLHSGEFAGSGSALLRDRLFTLPTHSRVREIDANRLMDWLSDRRVAVSAEAWAT